MIPSQFPVPVVRLVILDEELRVLLLRRSAGAFSGGLWCLPGGKVDFGNTLAETVEQELREETGLKVTNCRFLFPQDSLPAAMGEMHCINLYFEVFASGHLRINEESSDACWFGHEELAGLEIAFRNGEALERYFDEFAR